MYGQDYDKNHGIDNKDFPEWVAKKIEKTFHSFCYPLHSSYHFICSKQDSLKEKYKDKNILILGGGGSTKKFLEKNTIKENICSLWSLNNFFKSSLITKYHIDLVSLGPEVDLQDSHLNEYLHFFNVDIGIELHQKWSREQINNPLVKEVNKFALDNNSTFCFQTRYFSILGSGARLVILACELGASGVAFTGFDGPEAIWAADHAFEEGKNFMTYRAQGYPKDQVIQMFKDEYNWFWNYIKTTYPHTTISPLDDTYGLHTILYK